MSEDEKKDETTPVNDPTSTPPVETTTTPPPAASAEATTTPPTAAETGSDPVADKLRTMGVPDEVIKKIKEDLGATTVEDLHGLTEDDLVSCGMKKLPARKLINDLAEAKATATSTTATAPTASGPFGTMSFDILPQVPNDESWLKSLKAGGVLKIDQSTVISAIRAMLAHKAGLYTIPLTLVKLMEQFAEDSEEQVTPEYFKLRQDLTRRSYAEIFEAIPGLDGSYVTDARKNKLFERTDQFLWPAVVAFNEQLKSWYETWTKGAMNPAMMMSAFMGAAGGGAGVIPPGMMQPPDTGILHDYSDAVNDAINKLFAGTGVQIAAALAYEATRIRETLENPSLPAMIGVPNRDQLLRRLGVAVSPTYPRLEVNITRYVLAIIRADEVSSGNEEYAYFGTLFTLGSQIPWDQLSGVQPDSQDESAVTSIGGGRRPKKDL